MTEHIIMVLVFDLRVKGSQIFVLRHKRLKVDIRELSLLGIMFLLVVLDIS